MTILDLTAITPGLLESGAAIGGKARGLHRMLALGQCVPPALVVPAAVVVEDSALIAAARALPALDLAGPPTPERFAVRSSAAVEDGAQHSFAGQFLTLLDVPGEELPEAVRQVRDSGRALRALALAGRQGVLGGPSGDGGRAEAGEGIAVIVQRMVPADRAGVAFTADPDSGERDVLRIEAVEGLGERLVSGATSPEAWVVRGTGAEKLRASPRPVLEPAQVRRLATCCRALEVAFGHPLDIEWAIAGERLFLLQARPITRLPAAPIPVPCEPPEGSWDREDHHAVVSPLGWAWLQAYPEAMGEAMRELGLPVTAMEIRQVGGRLYHRMVMPGGDAVPPRWVMWLVTRLLPSMRRADRIARQMIDEDGFLASLRAWREEIRPAFQAEVRALDLPDPGALDDPALLARIQATLELSARGLRHHARLHMPGFFGLGKLALFLEDELQWPMNRSFELVAGSSPGTTRMNRELAALLDRHADEVERAGGPPASWAALHRRCPELHAALLRWLAENRLHMQHYEPGNPTLGEQPGVVLAALPELWAHRREPDAAAQSADELAESARAALPAERRADFDRILRDAREIFGLRDENGIELVSLPAGLLRHFVLELGRRLPALERPEHAVYLLPEEHGPALRGALPDLAERVARRRGEESWTRRQVWPRRFGKPRPPMPDLGAFPGSLRKMMRIFDWLDKVESLPEPEPDEAALRGVGVGQRLVTGRVRVLAGPDELSTLRSGEIAVCRITSPEWTLGLHRMAALITDEGGALSHPAIIARELGIPAVLGTEHATARLRTGERVEVDPAAGRVRRLDPRGEAQA